MGKLSSGVSIFVMWCFRKNCLNKEDFKKKMAETKKDEPKKNTKVAASKDFRLALQAICNVEGFAGLEAQHLN